ncbi:hypothetical protein TWF481_009969 [Arthrobotrys musiformis]|uniref:Uncharacterized protein n=1 Tax=Arthrobotrys musiformis TaxID=47236 RepID=A0AAV9VZC3_9PEZI
MASISSSSTSLVSDKRTLPQHQSGFLKGPRRLLSAFLVVTKAAGVNIINFIVAYRNSELRPERPKVAIDGRKWVSLSRCVGIHILPVLATITIFWLNGVNYYIGGNLAASSNEETDKAYLNILQVAAKAQELLVLGSLATMVADYVRYHACVGDGVPFAALTASFTFTSLGYIYSPEYWSVLLEIPSGTAKAITRKLLFAIFLLAVTVAGAFIGPATAITIIPAIDWFPAGSPIVNINLPPGTSSELPLTLTSSNVPRNCSNANATLSDPACPAAGYYSIMSWARSIGKRDPLYYIGVQQYNPKVVNSDFATEIIFQPIFELRRYFNIIRCGQPKYREMAVLLDERRNWQYRLLTLSNFDLGRYRYRFRSDAKVNFRSEAPRTLVICDQTVALANATVLAFPIPQTADGWETAPDAEKFALSVETNILSYVTANITTGGAPIVEKWAEWAGVNSTAGFRDPKWRLQWVRSESRENSDPDIASARAVVYAPTSDQSDGTSRIAFTCSIISHWLPSKSSVDVNLDVSIRQFTSKQTIEHEFAKTSVKEFYKDNDTATYRRSYIDQDPIMLEPDWLDALTPNIMSPQDYDTRGRELTIENTLTDSLGGDAALDDFGNDLAISSILCATVSDGLSRINTNSVPYPFTSSENFYPLDLNFEVQGYGYKTDSRTSQWALALLAGHLLLVLLHVAWTISISRSFKAWETFSEVIALVLNSDKSDVVDNCCAGIERFSTLSNTVLIREVGEDKRLGVVFSKDVDAAGLKLDKVSADVKYPIY